MFEAALLDAVKLIRLESPDATAKEVHARLIAEGLNVELGQVKKVARQVTKCAAEGPTATPLKVPPSAPASAAIRCLRLHGLPPELAHLNGEHAVVSEACTEAESATLLSAECAKVLTLLSKCSVTVPLACMELTDAPADVLFSNNEFAVVKTPGRGLGMRAQRALKKHELVLRENPLSGSINIGRSTSTMGASDAVLWQLLQQLEAFFRRSITSRPRQSRSSNRYSRASRNSTTISCRSPSSSDGWRCTIRSRHPRGPNSRRRWDVPWCPLRVPL
jgi:hypothetical protein